MRPGAIGLAGDDGRRPGADRRRRAGWRGQHGGRPGLAGFLPGAARARAVTTVRERDQHGGADVHRRRRGRRIPARTGGPGRPGAAPWRRHDAGRGGRRGGAAADAAGRVRVRRARPDRRLVPGAAPAASDQAPAALTGSAPRQRAAPPG